MDAVFPENIYCICCGDSIDPSVKNGLCARCANKMPWALDNPFRSYMDEFAFDDVLPCVRYGSYARRIMNGLKNGGQNYMAKAVGRMLAERLQLSWDMPDLLAAVPSHKSKLRKRGYNQAELLAEAAAGIRDGIVIADLNILVTQFCDGFHCAEGILRHHVAHGIENQTDFNHVNSLLLLL